jgi:phosphoribosylaminoimidazole-succinocarboxamide synthase
MPTHFIRRLNMREQLIREVEIIPLEVVVRNVAAGSLSSASASRKAPCCRARSSSSTTRTTSSATRWSPRSTSPPSAGRRRRRSTTSCAGHPRQRLPLRPVPRRRHPAGRLQDRVRPALGGRHDAHRLADEISPDSCRLWDIAKTNEKLDKDRFRRDLGGRVEGLPGSRAPARHPASSTRRERPSRGRCPPSASPA